ncbi:MAG: hypothetical protein AUK54_05955 [Helicobacteraceae bacterium CG2_30_36_10]|nr:MAG: hypothetical protein AUK54_05955 [Helicobacteraceae bacterium CG2_30_36_10]
MKNTLKKVFIVSALISSLVASDTSEYLVDTYSLVGLEGGYSSLDVERQTAGIAISATKQHNFGHGGFKIGAQGENYRLFLSGRYYNAKDFDYMTTMGAELQYMFNFSSFSNFFLGVNTGLANIRFVDDSSISRTISDTYVGADAGFNFHLAKSVDFEIGARVMNMQAENTISGVTYTFDNMLSGYASIIFKYKMD